jgi:hypothetical protein
VVSVSEEKPADWFLDITPTEPPKILGGERNLVIMGAGAAALFGFMVAPKVSGSFAGVPFFLVVMALALGFYLAWNLIAAICWRIDPWMLTHGWRMDGTLPRFLKYPGHIPAHASGASSEGARYTEKRREHLKR